MRRIGAFVIAGVLMVCAGGSGASAAEKDVEKIPFCQYCGMDRARFASTRMLVEYANGTTIGTCSIHCAAIDLAQSFGKEIRTILVADYQSGKLVDAAKATWVVGAGVPAVMAAKSRVAFAAKGDAEAFRKTSGGDIASFDAALGSAYCDMPSDTRSIREWRARSGSH